MEDAPLMRFKSIFLTVTITKSSIINYLNVQLLVDFAQYITFD